MYEVYGYLKGGLQGVTEDTDFFDFAQSLMIYMGNWPEEMMRTLELLLGKPAEKIMKMDTGDVFIYFLEGLKENKLLTFHDFMKRMAKHGRG